MRKGSVFHKKTDKFMAYGYEESSAIAKAIEAGHFFMPGVNGSGPEWKKLEGGKAVIDIDRINTDNGKVLSKEERIERLRAAKEDLDNLIKSESLWSPDDIQHAMGLINTVLNKGE